MVTRPPKLLICIVPAEYFSYLDHTGRRTDIAQHPELCYGSFEYIANKDYCKVQCVCFSSVAMVTFLSACFLPEWCYPKTGSILIYD